LARPAVVARCAMRRRATLLAAGLGVIALAVVPSIARPTAAAWTDDATFAASASAAEFFGCQQGPVVVTTFEAPPAQTLTVQGIGADCAGADLTVEVYDTQLGGAAGQIVAASSFETGDGGWAPYGGGGGLDRRAGVALSGG